MSEEKPDAEAVEEAVEHLGYAMEVAVDTYCAQEVIDSIDCALCLLRDGNPPEYLFDEDGNLKSKPDVDRE